MLYSRNLTFGIEIFTLTYLDPFTHHVVRQIFFFIDLVFIFIYLVELVVKMIGLGVVGYFWRFEREKGKRCDKMNTVDASVCITVPLLLVAQMIVEQPWEPCSSSSFTGRGVNLRLVVNLIVITRVVRIFRIVRYWKVRTHLLPLNIS